MNQGRRLKGLRCPEPDASGFEEADEDADGEIKILRRGLARRRRQLDPALAEVAIQSALLLHDLGCERAMKYGDQQPQQQSCDLYHHYCLNLNMAV